MGGDDLVVPPKPLSVRFPVARHPDEPSPNIPPKPISGQLPIGPTTREQSKREVSMLEVITAEP
jgi:hypothetical protein